MSDEMVWPEVRLESVAEEVTVGFVGPMTSEYRPAGIPFLRSKNIDPFSVNTDDLRYISTEFHRRIYKSRLRPGDVVIVRTGDPGKTAVIPEWLEESNCADLVIVRPSSAINSHYLAYFVNALARHQVSAHTVGAVQQHFNVGSAKQLLLPLPKRNEQDAIVAILRALDGKIELNHRTNHTLETIAQAIFKSWFVDFDPVTAKAAGRKPYGMSEATAALFPKRFAESSLGFIPEGWATVDIYQIADVIYGAPFASRLFTSEHVGLPLIRIRDLTTHKPEVFTPEQHPKQTIIQPGDIVVGMDGEFRVYHWQGTQALLNQRVCTFRPKAGVPKAFVSHSVREPLDFFERSKTGTTVIHLGKADIDTFRIVVPGQELLSAFAKVADPIIDRIVANSLESQTLAALRDSLLPKLLSGEVRVRQAEKFVAEAV